MGFGNVYMLGTLGLSHVCVSLFLFFNSQCHLLSNESPVRSVMPAHACLRGTVIIAVRDN